jgi:PD-(D/E)XK nuclease superfamily
MSPKTAAAPPEYQQSLHRIAKPSLLATSARRTGTVRPTKEKPLILSASELSSFLRCRVQHHWSYQCRLTLPSKNLAQSIGTLGHIVLDNWYQLPVHQRTPRSMKRVAVDAMQKSLTMSKKEMALDPKDRELITAMCVGYAEWTLNPDTDYGDADLQITDCHPEEWFDLPLTPDGSIRIRGKLDNRFFPGKYKKSVAILESKFKSAIRYDDVENRLQLSVYLWALRQKFPKMRRFMAFPQILRKQLPTPRVRTALFWRDLIERDDTEVDQWATDTGNIAMDILDGAVYPTPMDSCAYMCDFKVPCQLRGNKEELKYVLKNNYVTRTSTGGGKK